MTDDHSLTAATVPDVRRRPALDRWMRDRDIDDAAGGKLFGCSKQMVHAMRRRFDDPLRKRPGPVLLTNIVRVTRGDVRPEDFSPPVSDILGGLAA